MSPATQAIQKTGSLPIVVAQHAEESALLWSRRTALAAAPHVKLHHLRRFDDRLAAHLDGLAVAGEEGTRFAWAALEHAAPAEVFVAAVRAIEERDAKRLEQLFALCGAVPDACRGLISAFGWVSSTHLTGLVKQLLAHADPLHRMVGLAACSMHGADPGAALDTALYSEDGCLRARALRVVGELGRVGYERALLEAIANEDSAIRYWAAWSATLLGNREAGLVTLGRFCLEGGPYREQAMRIVLRTVDLSRGREILRRIARDEPDSRILIQGAGIAGDPLYLPWLLKQMSEMTRTRLAGESFSMITGLDLAYLDLDRKPPEGVEPGPNDDPDDPDVSMDPDEDLPWPDVEKIERWWNANQSSCPQGTRFFMGAPVGHEHCLHVLREGFQRQRSAAAIYRSLLEPGTPLFGTQAPAPRQGRRLARL